MTWWQRNRRAGKCGQCGKVPPETKKARCKDCAAKHQKCGQRTYAKRKDDSKCTKCEAPTENGYAKCKDCLVYHNKRVVDLRESRRDDGKCRCGEDPEDGMAMCSKCQMEYNGWTQERRSRLYAEGLCGCGREPAHGRATCHECMRRIGLRKHIKFILLRDGDHCEICLKPLPDDDSGIHVHHVHPVAMGGTDEVDNLSLTHAMCNLRLGATWIYETPTNQIPKGGWR